MFGKNNIFSGILTVVVVACIVFVYIFFFNPEVSLKYFGTAFRMNKTVSTAINSMVGESMELDDEQKKAVISYLDSDEGKKVVSVLSDAARRGEDSLAEAMESEEVKKMEKEISSMLTKENLDSLLENLSSVSSDLFGRFAK